MINFDREHLKVIEDREFFEYMQYKGNNTISFSGCTALTYIGEEAFYNIARWEDSELPEVTLDLSDCDNLAYIGYDAFGKVLITELILPDNPNLAYFERYLLNILWNLYHNEDNKTQITMKWKAKEYRVIYTEGMVNRMYYTIISDMMEDKLSYILTHYTLKNYKGLAYKIEEQESGKTVTIKGFYCKKWFSNVTIPAEIEGYPVTSIGPYAFSFIPDTFLGVINLDLSQASNLNNIDRSAFAGTQIAGSKVDFSGCGSSLYVGKNAFSDCRLTEVEFGDRVCKIDTEAFSHNSCKGSKIPENVTAESDAFGYGFPISKLFPTVEELHCVYTMYRRYNDLTEQEKAEGNYYAV